MLSTSRSKMAKSVPTPVPYLPAISIALDELRNVSTHPADPPWAITTMPVLIRWPTGDMHRSGDDDAEREREPERDRDDEEVCDRECDRLRDWESDWTRSDTDRLRLCDLLGLCDRDVVHISWVSSIAVGAHVVMLLKVMTSGSTRV
jgi:hypothetical protein